MPKQVVKLKLNGGEYSSEGRYAASHMYNMQPVIAQGTSIGENGAEICTLIKPSTNQPPVSLSSATINPRGWVMDTVNRKVYVVIGMTMYVRSDVGTWTTIAASANQITGNTDQPVSMAFNGEVIAIVANGNADGWYYNINSGVFELIDQAPYGSPYTTFGVCVGCAFQDSYFVFINKQNTVFHGGLPTASSGKVVAPTDFSSTEVSGGGYNTAVVSLSNYLVVMTQYSTQFFDNVGAENFAFQRVSVINIGCHHDSLKTKSGDIIYFVGSGDGSPLGVYSIDQNGSATKISTDSIDRSLQEIDESIRSYGSMYTYTHKGRSYLVLNKYGRQLWNSGAGDFGIGDTWQYDILGKVWCRRSSQSVIFRWYPVLAFPSNSSSSTEDRNGYIFLGRDPLSIGVSGPPVITQWQNVKISDSTYSTNDVFLATSNWIDGGGNGFIVNKVTVLTDGIALSVGGVDLSYSYDGENLVSIGKVQSGEYTEFYGIGYFDKPIMFVISGTNARQDYKVLKVYAEVESLGE